MELKDVRQIDAAPEEVWAAILDPDVLKACVPGCETLTGSVEDGFEATVVQKVGPVKATFKGTVTVSDIGEGESCLLTGEGKGGAAGFAKGSARVHLAPEGAGTRLSYEVDARVGGKLAQLGARIIDGFARKMADDFFSRFQAVVEGGGAVPGADTDGGPAEDPEDSAGKDTAAEGTAAKKGWLKRIVSG